MSIFLQLYSISFKMFSLVLLLLLITSVHVNTQSISSQWRFPNNCDLNCTFYILWVFNPNTQNIDFYLDTPFDLGQSHQWSAIGFNTQQQMNGGDAIVGYSDAQGVGSVEDRYLSGYSASLDAIQNVNYFRVSVINNRQIIRFSRSVLSSDLTNDVSLNQDVFILFAKGSYTQQASLALNKHSVRAISPSVKLNSLSNGCTTATCFNGGTCLADIGTNSIVCVCAAGKACDTPTTTSTASTTTATSTLAAAIAVPICLLVLFAAIAIVIVIYMKKYKKGCFKRRQSEYEQSETVRNRKAKKYATDMASGRIMNSRLSYIDETKQRRISNAEPNPNDSKETSFQ